MKDESAEAQSKTSGRVITSVLLFWVGYLAITLVVGFATMSTIGSEVWQLTAWGFISSAGLIALSRFLMRNEKGPRTNLDLAVIPSSVGRFSFGVLIGVASFGVHVAILTTFAAPIRFELVSGGGVVIALIFFARFLSTSCMEELGFRGYSLRRLTEKMGTWPAVCLTSLVFGLSHLSYGYDLRSIALGVIPGGLLWGMSAIATRGLAVPIGLHAAWNFANWSAGGRAETGLLKVILEENTLELTQQVGTASHLSIFGALTVAFWFVHRRHVRLGELAPPNVKG